MIPSALFISVRVLPPNVHPERRGAKDVEMQTGRAILAPNWED